jgi:regulation of enolase protein 1 (concanavalin A-like superfamily)/HKD family nuclease
MRKATYFAVLTIFAGCLSLPSTARAQTRASGEWLCDSSTTDCRQPLLDLINAETVGIDVGFWFMEDARYVSALVNRWRAGVSVRVLMDTKANATYPGNVPNLQTLRNAGIPMRQMTGSYLHWKMMLFAGQNVVEFGSANYSPSAFVPEQARVNFIDETIYFSNDPEVVNSFKTKFDDAWVNTSAFRDYANLTNPPTREYPVFPIDAELNFPPSSNFATRAVARYNAEPTTGGIDAMMYRVTDARHADALIAAHRRGVPVRLIIEQFEYRLANRWQHAWNVDRLMAAGVRVRQRSHEGRHHEKLMLLKNQKLAIFGSQNWSETSGQYEHNYFTKKLWIYNWFVTQFNRKWTSTTYTEPFVPLPPDVPQYNAPARGANVTTTTATLRWNAGPWAHKYDIYFGTSSNPPLVASNVELGNSTTSTDYVTYQVTGLARDTTYYWKVVSKTMMNLTRSGTVWSFRTGAPPQPSAGDVVLWTSRATAIRGWTRTTDSTAAGGSRLGTSDAGVSVASALASPTRFFEMSFTAAAGGPYRLWIRGKANGNNWASDSAFVQFSDSVTSSGGSTWRIGTTSATTVSIEDCTSCGLAAWGWNDNLTNGTAGALGTPVYFANSGTHTLRIQVREDGLGIDQIVLSRGALLNVSPGVPKNDTRILTERGFVASPPLPPPPPPLPTGWQSRDIGSVGRAGSADHSNGTYTVSGGGADVWGTADAFHYAYRTMSGDGTIVARVASISGSEAWTKMGVMIRNSTASNASYAFMIVSKGKGLAFQRRTSNGASATGTTPIAGTAPRWVRLVRRGNVITASTSTNGTSWTTVGSSTISMSTSVLVGLAAHSHTTTALATAVFDNVRVTTP